MEYKTLTNNFQLPIQEVEEIVKTNSYRKIVEERLSLISKQYFSINKYHNIKHAKNTALFALIISNFVNVAKKDINLLIDAALLHDIGRKNDFDDLEHGRVGAQIAYDIKKGDSFYTLDTLHLLMAIIEGHCQEIYDNSIIEKYQISDVSNYRKLLQILKDADCIDRTRIIENPLILIEKINYDISKKLFLFSKKENEMKEESQIPKSKEDLIHTINEFLTLYRKELTKEEFLAIKRKIIYLSQTEIYSRQALKEYENFFLKYYTKIWQKSLTNFEDYNGQEDFKFLITCPTVRAENFNIKSVFSASLISNQHLGTFNKIPVGIVLEIGEDSILGISEKDMNSLVVKQNEVVNSYFYLNSTKNEKIYTKNEIISLKTPKQIEIASIQENVRQNGNILLLGNHSVYNDILVDGEKVKMKGIVIIEPCDREWHEEAQKLANKFNLKMKPIDYPY